MIGATVDCRPGDRLLALVDAFAGVPRRRARRSDRRRVHLRPRRPRVARGAGPDPRVRLDRDRARRRRQRRQQRRRARRRRQRSSASSAATSRAGGCSTRCARARRRRGVVRAARLSHAGQDAHPRRRRPLGQAAGRAHRSRPRARRSPTPTGAAIARAALRGAAPRATRVLVSDYGSGLVTPALVARAQRTLRGAGTRSRPVLVDSRYALLELPRPDGVHAERVRGRAAARRPHRRRTRACSSGPAATLLRADADAARC